MAKLEPLKSGYYVWHYVPSIAAAVIFILLFLIVTIYHFWKIFRTKVRFTIPFAIGGLFEFIGYAARAGASSNTGKLMPYIIQSVFVLLAPTLFAAAVYMVLARIIRAVDGEQYSPIRIDLITKIFVTCDIVTFFVQGGGAGMMAQSSLTHIGQDIVLAGLVLQIITFVLFVVTAVAFARRMGKSPTHTAAQGSVPWKKHLHSLYIISSMILIRSIFRVIEYGLGNDGYLLAHEWPNYIFDAVPMLIAMCCFAVWYPSDLQSFLKSPNFEYSMS
ncbi:hypothetical protein N7462_004828 [Penicillium macrosclerotiorum]|uniref:uncharacterized protein n=1 Tax=Penicillium macrosclerotiorum TaxID=303699 RepID=UPI002547B9A5|nr:uncharacterized protein N7462_004828 [Penicillium macrosclerotiorum]KAJ5690436.1 hypothetical protein N7462_004828 [Penicillium macrosclerotiorum]